MVQKRAWKRRKLGPKHHCHYPSCPAPCAPRYLMCRDHWAAVPRAEQAEVYRTVVLRGKLIDASWAPWWRAQASAIYAAMKIDPQTSDWRDKWLARELETATKMEQGR